MKNLEPDHYKIVCEAWGDTLPPTYACERFGKEIIPLLKYAKIDDPYTQERIQCIMTECRLKAATEALESNSFLSQELSELVGKGKAVKSFFTACFVGGIAAAVLGLTLSFMAGAITAEGWTKYKIAQAEQDERERVRRNEFLKSVNAALMQCEDGEIEIQGGKKVCFYGAKGWFIE